MASGRLHKDSVMTNCLAILSFSAQQITAAATVVISLLLLAFASYQARRGITTKIMIGNACVLATTVLTNSAVLALRFSGASQTVQLNNGNDRAMDIWSLWVEIWPALMSLLAFTGLVLLILILVFLIHNWRLKQLLATRWSVACLLLTACHLIFSFGWLMGHFPDA
jgi:hypothetical protein